MSAWLLHAGAFALMLGVLIVVHELGHYSAARLLGVKVLRFSVGFGRGIWSRRFGRDGTEWVIGVFPLGGYVKMLDEEEACVLPEELARSFNRQSVWRRVAIVLAGPCANLLLAVLLYWGLFFYGVEEFKPILARPAIQTAAFAAGVENGDRVIKVGGVPVLSWQEFHWELLRQAVKGDVVELETVGLATVVSIRRLLDVSAARGNGLEGDFIERLGLAPYRPEVPAVVGAIGKGSPAEVAGLLPGDRILAIGGLEIAAWSDAVNVVRNSPGKRLNVDIERQGARRQLVIEPAVVPGTGGSIGRIGAAVAEDSQVRDLLMVKISYGAVGSVAKAIQETWEKSIFSVVMIGKMLTGEVSWRNISGPVTIADYAGQSAKLGLTKYVAFLALVSVSLGVLNLLPVPVLDGGHLLYYSVEIVRGKPLSERSREIGQRIGLAILAMLMTLAFYNDINRLIPG
ncbi:RIP metalloprotease RseP [Propionivibrio limicola]|uniref:RIP metalloprotease RseP n=1 Tax=Propionivibrio limicola TaxID=167645 RepID=UPI001291041B|nr:RIP metalloprotease RseP [Propionivibrio limicola]